jgi:hypothetical protein
MSGGVKGTIRASFQLDPDDEGETGAPYGAAAPAQDAAFQDALRRAIAMGRERAAEGVKQADPNDNRYVRRVAPPTVLRTASSSYYD